MRLRDEPQELLRTYELIHDPLGRTVLEARLRRTIPPLFRKGFIEWQFGRVSLSTRI